MFLVFVTNHSYSSFFFVKKKKKKDMKLMRFNLHIKIYNASDY